MQSDRFHLRHWFLHRRRGTRGPQIWIRLTIAPFGRSQYEEEGILERLAAGPVVGDGGYLFELEKRGYVQAGPFTPEVSIVHPEALLQMHREFLYAGADVLQALTFYASEEKLATVGLGGKVDEINKAATAIARQAAAESDALVAGNLTLTWSYDPDDPKSDDVVAAQFDRQLQDQMELGIDFVICETYSFIGEALIATERAKQTGLPVMTTMSFTKLPHAEEGDSAAECAKKLVDAGADIVGVNCLRSPEAMLPLVREMREAVSGLRCRATGRLPGAGGQPRLHVAPGVPLRARHAAAPAPRLRRLHERGPRPRRELHRCVLRRGRRARSAMAKVVGQVARRGTRVEVSDGQADVGVRVLRARRDRRLADNGRRGNLDGSLPRARLDLGQDPRDPPPCNRCQS